MALISPNTFLAPFTNKVHFGTIVFVVALFAAFRLAGGSMSVEDSASARSNLSSKEILPEEDLSVTSEKELSAPKISQDSGKAALDPANELQRLGIPVRKSEIDQLPTDNNESDDILGNMVESPSKRATSSGKEHGDLDDIERRLGLK